MDFLYSAEELKNVKIEAEKTNLPLLLYLTNNKWIAKIKLILFKWWAKFWYSTTSHILGILALMIANILIVIITQIPFVQANVSKSPFFIPSGMILGASLGGVLPLFRKYGCKILQEQSILKKMLAALSFLGVFVFSFIMFSLTYIAFFFARSTSLLWLSLFILFLCLSIFFGQGLMQSLLISLDVDTTNKVNFRFGKKTLVTKAIYMAFLKQKSFTINIRFDSFFLLESLYGYSIAFHENLHLSRPLNLYTFQEQKIIDSSFKLLGLKFINCELENIKLSGRVMQIHFEKTSFRNVDFSKLNILIKPPFRLVLKDISPEKIDAYSLQSLRQFVKKHELKVSLKVRKQQEKSSSLIEGIKKYYFKTSQQVLADDWLLKKLEEDLK